MSGAADEPGDRIFRGGHLARVGGHAAVTSGTCDNPAAGASGSVGYSHDRRALDLCFVRSARVIDRGVPSSQLLSRSCLFCHPAVAPNGISCLTPARTSFRLDRLVVTRTKAGRALTDISRLASSPLVRVCGAALLRSRGQVEQTEPGLLRTSLAQEGVLVHVHAKR